jgi:EthD domain
MTPEHEPTSAKLLIAFTASAGHDLTAARAAFGPTQRGAVAAAFAIRVPDPAQERFAQAGRLDHETVAALEVSGPLGDQDRLTPVALEALDRLGSTVDREAATLMIGPVVEVVAGTGRFVAFHTLRRLDNLTHEEFVTYWSGGHTRFSASVPGLTGYQQLQVDEATSLEAGRRCGIAFARCDGVSSIRANTVDEYAAVINAPQAARGIQDNTVFIDTSRSPWCGLYDTEAGVGSA